MILHFCRINFPLAPSLDRSQPQGFSRGKDLGGVYKLSITFIDMSKVIKIPS